MNTFYKTIASNVLKRIDLKSLKNKTALVTGANGLLGSHLAAVLACANDQLGLNCKVLCTSRSSAPQWMTDVFASKGFSYLAADLGAGIPSAIKDQAWDVIIHAATYGQPRKFLESAVATMQLNSTITKDLLDLAAKTKGAFLFMSTSELYGNPPAEFSPSRENCPALISPTDQRAPYNAAKLFSETLCSVYNSSGAVKARVARVSSVFGPGVNLKDDRVLNVFIMRALQTGALKLMDQGLQKRKWLYIEDALVMFFHILLNSDSLVYNVSGSEMASIGELAKIVAEFTRVKTEFPPAVEEAAHTKGSLTMIDLDNQKILQEAKINRLVSFADGVSATVEWYKQLLKAEV